MAGFLLSETVFRRGECLGLERAISAPYTRHLRIVRCVHPEGAGRIDSSGLTARRVESGTARFAFAKPAADFIDVDMPADRGIDRYKPTLICPTEERLLALTEDLGGGGE
jgi:hypothetical protein